MGTLKCVSNLWDNNLSTMYVHEIHVVILHIWTHTILCIVRQCFIASLVFRLYSASIDMRELTHAKQKL